MTRLRRFLSVFGLALALATGQQAAALHDLGHATGQLTQKHDSKTGPSKCNLCFACAELSGAVGATAPVVPVVALGDHHFRPASDRGAPSAPFFAFRSRAPPTLL
jgi:hypothetical protein